MNRCKRRLIIHCVWLAASLPPGVMAQALHQDAQAHQSAAVPLAEGQVRRVDKAWGRLTITHGEIRNLDMPPMTMVFAVRDKAVLDTVKAGDRIRFQAVHESGQYIVTHVEPAP